MENLIQQSIGILTVGFLQGIYIFLKAAVSSSPIIILLILIILRNLTRRFSY